MFPAAFPQTNPIAAPGHSRDHTSGGFDPGSCSELKLAVGWEGRGVTAYTQNSGTQEAEAGRLLQV